jgi:hypothetical protein
MFYALIFISVSGAHVSLNCSIISLTYWFMIWNVTKILEKIWKCTVRTKFQSHFFHYFLLSSCNVVTTVKKRKMIIIYFWNKFKNMFLHQNKLETVNLPKKIENFPTFFLSVVQSVWCSNQRKFHADRRIFKHCERSVKMSNSFLSRWHEKVNNSMRPSLLEHILARKLYGKIS